MNKEDCSNRSLSFEVFGAAAFALLLLNIDTVRAVRDDHWGGFYSDQIGGMGLAFAVYFLPLLLLAVSLGAVCKGLKLKSGFFRHAILVVGACSTWACAAWAASPVPRSYLLLGFCAVAGLGALLFIIRCLRKRTSAWHFVLCCIFGGLALAWNLGASTEFLASPDRRAIAAAIALGSAGTATLALGLALRIHGKRRAVAILLGILAAGAPLLGHLFWPFLAAASASSQHSLFLLSSDALRADACEPFGEGQNTPAIRALAEGGVWFPRSYSCAPWTIPSLVALMSSQYASEVKGQVSFDRENPSMPDARRYEGMPSHETLAEALANQGYETAGFLGNPLLRMLRVGNDGFHTARQFDFLIKDAAGPFTHTPIALAVLRRCGYSPPVRPVDLTAQLVLYTKSFFRLQTLNRKPFFLWVHFGDPHAPYTPPSRYCPTPALAARMRNLTEETWPATPIGIHYFEKPSEAEQADLIDLYAAEVRYVDAAIGEIMRDAEAMGLLDSTLVCMTSDHGEEFWEHGCWGHGCTMYEAGVRVPLILNGPGIEMRGPRDVLVSGYDLAPTLTRFLGLDVPEAWIGTDFSPWLLGKAEAPNEHPIFMQGTLPYVEIPPQQALIQGKQKLIRTQPEDLLELYNLSRDAQERHDLSKAPTVDLSGLLDALETHAAQAPVPPALEELDGSGEAFTEELRALGYL